MKYKVDGKTESFESFILSKKTFMSRLDDPKDPKRGRIVELKNDIKEQESVIQNNQKLIDDAPTGYQSISSTKEFEDAKAEAEKQLSKLKADLDALYNDANKPCIIDSLIIDLSEPFETIIEQLGQYNTVTKDFNIFQNSTEETLFLHPEINIDEIKMYRNTIRACNEQCRVFSEEKDTDPQFQLFLKEIKDILENNITPIKTKYQTINNVLNDKIENGSGKGLFKRFLHALQAILTKSKVDNLGFKAHFDEKPFKKLVSDMKDRIQKLKSTQPPASQEDIKEPDKNPMQKPP